jgi:hypothetical protein
MEFSRGREKESEPQGMVVFVAFTISTTLINVDILITLWGSLA